MNMTSNGIDECGFDINILGSTSSGFEFTRRLVNGIEKNGEVKLITKLNNIMNLVLDILKVET